eukprot:362754-Chlamydomonas_euryale.AAC.15
MPTAHTESDSAPLPRCPPPSWPTTLRGLDSGAASDAPDFVQLSSSKRRRRQKSAPRAGNDAAGVACRRRAHPAEYGAAPESAAFCS